MISNHYQSLWSFPTWWQVHCLDLELLTSNSLNPYPSASPTNMFCNPPIRMQCQSFWTLWIACPRFFFPTFSFFFFHFSLLFFHFSLLFCMNPMFNKQTKLEINKQQISVMTMNSTAIIMHLLPSLATQLRKGKTKINNDEEDDDDDNESDNHFLCLKLVSDLTMLFLNDVTLYDNSAVFYFMLLIFKLKLILMMMMMMMNRILKPLNTWMISSQTFSCQCMKICWLMKKIPFLYILLSFFFSIFYF